MKNTSGEIVIVCLAMIAVLIIAIVVFALLGPDHSIPWVETIVTLPGNPEQFVYRQKGSHYAMVRFDCGATSNECWIPWRPIGGPVNVYHYSDAEDGISVRLEDRFFEVLIDIKRAKTYLLVRPCDGLLFKGEIIAPEDGSRSSRINDGPWDVEVGNRKAENISTSAIVTNRGLYIGRIEVTGSKGTAPPLLRFIPVREGSEQLIKKE